MSRILADHGIGLFEIQFPDEIGNIAGMIDMENRTIFVNESSSDSKKSFTVAHELGHWILHQSALRRDPTRYAVVYRHDTDTSPIDPIEAEANSFAAHLLVPRSMLDRYHEVLSVPKLARLFGVSPDIIERRLAEEYGT